MGLSESVVSQIRRIIEVFLRLPFQGQALRTGDSDFVEGFVQVDIGAMKQRKLIDLPSFKRNRALQTLNSSFCTLAAAANPLNVMVASN